MKTFKKPRYFLGWYADACVAHDKFGGLAILRSMHSYRNASLKGKFEGVRQEVEDDLFPHIAVDWHALRHWFAADLQFQSGLVRGGLKICRQLSRKPRQLGGLEIGIGPPG